jgi:hypothetical protein
MEIHLKKNTMHVDANVNTRKENQDHQNNNNEVKDVMLERHLCHKSANDGGALVGMRGKGEEL